METPLGVADPHGVVGGQIELWHVFVALRLAGADAGCAHATGGTLGFAYRKCGCHLGCLGTGKLRYAGLCTGFEPVD